ncbi:MAG: hypothetical protein H6719_34250 [Sandaracinaceae bacterium]|nr:hypothetical protein [Sandaracinaceae bacterium]
MLFVITVTDTPRRAASMSAARPAQDEVRVGDHHAGLAPPPRVTVCLLDPALADPEAGSG